MQQIEINGQQYLCVEVPEGAKDFILEPTGRDNILSLLWTVNKYWHHEPLPAGNYEIVGLVKDLRHSYEHDNWVLDYVFNYPELMEKYNLTDNTLILKIKENE